MPIQWQGCYGGTEIDKATDIVEADNGYLIIGETRSNDGDVSNNHGSRDIWVINIDSTGNLLWERSYGGTEIDLPKSIIKGIDGYYYFVAEVGSNDGDIQSGNHGVYDVWVVKINGTGDIIWEKCYGGSGWDDYPNLKLLSDGNLLITCNSTSSDGDVPVNYGVYDAWVFVISPEGEILKNAVFGNDLQNEAPVATETQDGGFILSCFASSTNGMVEGTYHGGMADVWVLKLDSNLSIEWQMLYGGSGWDSGCRPIIELTNGYVFLASTDSNDGDVSGFHGGFKDIWVVRIDLEGSIIWQRCLGGNDSEYSRNLLQTEDGGFVVFGNTSSNNGDVSGNHSFSGWDDIWMVKLSNNGELEWQQCFGSYGKETVLSGVIKKSDHNWVIAGSADYNSDDVNCNLNFLYVEDYWVFEIKDTTTGFNDIPATGGGLKIYPNPAKDYVIFELPAIAIKKAVISNHLGGNSAGVRNPPATSWNAYNFKETSNDHNSEEIPQATTKSQTQGFGMTTSDEITVVIVNIFGQTVKTLPVTSEKTVWDTRKVKGGIYFYNMEIDGKVLSGKIVVQN